MTASKVEPKGLPSPENELNNSRQIQHHQSSLHDQSLATEASAIMTLTGRNKFEDEPPSSTNKEATKTSLVLDMDELPQGYKHFETALLQSKNAGSIDAKDLLSFQIHKNAADEQS